MGRTVFQVQGDHDGRGLVSQNPGPCFFNAIKADAWPVPEATDIKTAARWPKSPGIGQLEEMHSPEKGTSAVIGTS